MKTFSKLVRRNLRTNKRCQRPSWTPIEDAFVEFPVESIDLGEQRNRGITED